ncbi:hypothetical protein EON66_04495 [archaeon]|nr:MAG: hypothetical protein EON66_04495 [archaeon]
MDVSVEVSTDTFSLDGASVLNVGTMPFGLASTEDSYFLQNGFDGMLGLALEERARVAAVTPLQVVARGASIPPKFGLYIAPHDAPCASGLSLGGYDASKLPGTAATFWFPLLQQGQPNSPPSGWDVWRAPLTAVLLSSPSQSTDHVLPGCATTFCTVTLASSYPAIGLPTTAWQSAVYMLNASCAWGCALVPDAASGETKLFCDASCALSALPNISFAIATPDGSGPTIRFPLLPSEYAQPTTMNGVAVWDMKFAEYRGSLAGELDVMLGEPFLRAYYTMFDGDNFQGTHACTARPRPFFSVLRI